MGRVREETSLTGLVMGGTRTIDIQRRSGGWTCVFTPRRGSVGVGRGAEECEPGPSLTPWSATAMLSVVTSVGGTVPVRSTGKYMGKYTPPVSAPPSSYSSGVVVHKNKNNPDRDLDIAQGAGQHRRCAIVN